MAIMSTPFSAPMGTSHNNPPLLPVNIIMNDHMSACCCRWCVSCAKKGWVKSQQKHHSPLTMVAITAPLADQDPNPCNNQLIDCCMIGWCIDNEEWALCVRNGWLVNTSEAWPSDNRCVSVRLIVVSMKINAWTYLPHYYWSCACHLIWRTSLRANENAVVCAMAKWWVCT